MCVRSCILSCQWTPVNIAQYNMKRNTILSQWNALPAGRSWCKKMTERASHCLTTSINPRRPGGARSLWIRIAHHSPVPPRKTEKTGPVPGSSTMCRIWPPPRPEGRDFTADRIKIIRSGKSAYKDKENVISIACFMRLNMIFFALWTLTHDFRQEMFFIIYLLRDKLPIVSRLWERYLSLPSDYFRGFFLPPLACSGARLPPFFAGPER